MTGILVMEWAHSFKSTVKGMFNKMVVSKHVI